MTIDATKGRTRLRQYDVFTMQVEVLISDPTLHWQAVARMLGAREDLRDDITLRVESDCLRFVYANGQTVRTLPPGKWTGSAIADIDVMLELLGWIEKEFGMHVAQGRFGCPIRGSRRRVRIGEARRAGSEQNG